MVSTRSPTPAQDQSATSHGIAADAAVMTTARVTEPRCHDAYSAIMTPRKNDTSKSTAVAHDDHHRHDHERGEQLGGHRRDETAEDEGDDRDAAAPPATRSILDH